MRTISNCVAEAVELAHDYTKDHPTILAIIVIIVAPLITMLVT